MTTRFQTIFAFLILTARIGYSQNFEPLDLAKQIFGKEKFSNIDKYITGEYKGQPNGQSLPKDATSKFLLLEQTESKAVVAMTVLDSTGKGFDTYLHFEKDTIWKMSAFRALALTGVIEQIKNGLEKMTPQQVDDMIKKSKDYKNDFGFSIFSSKEDYDFQLGNAKLTLELDDNIIKHFLDNKNEFERIKDSALKELENKRPEERENIKLVENLESDYRKLFISSITFGDYELGNCLNFLIGGMVDNAVGYIYVSDKKDIPKMNADNIIMIREIGNGWYMYKTT